MTERDKLQKERRDTLEIAKYSLTIAPEKSDSQRILKNVIDNWNVWNLSKLNRWIGFAQCQLVTAEITTVDDLRQQVSNIIERGPTTNPRNQNSKD